jgi:septum formation protein
VRLVLASASPRRAELLRAAGFDFVVRPADVDESVLGGEDPATHVRRLATVKAAAIESDAGREVILGADTVVVIDEDILGKPRDEAEAADMLRRLSGREHRVLTGVAVKRGGDVRVGVDQTRVWFETLTPEEIAWYVASGEPRDKAGAYAIQGLASRFVSRIEGSHTNVVGLPIHVVRRLLHEVRWK